MTAKIITALIQTTNFVFSAYFYLILIRCLLSWFPNINRYKQPVAFLYDITDWYLNLFRRFIPPFGGIDFSPIVAVFALYIIQYAVVYVLYTVGALFA